MTSFQNNNGAPPFQYMVPMHGLQPKGFGQQIAPQVPLGMDMPMMPGDGQENPFYQAWLRQFAGRPSMEGHGY